MLICPSKLTGRRIVWLFRSFCSLLRLLVVMNKTYSDTQNFLSFSCNFLKTIGCIGWNVQKETNFNDPVSVSMGHSQSIL